MGKRRYITIFMQKYITHTSEKQIYASEKQIDDLEKGLYFLKFWSLLVSIFAKKSI